MEGLTTGQMTNAAAWGLGIGTAFFSFAALRDDRDFFLCVGLVSCVIGNLVFGYYLFNQRAGGANETMVTLYVVLALTAIYAFVHQLKMYKEKGFADSDDEDEDDEEEEEEATPAGKPAADAAQLAGGAARPALPSPEAVQAAAAKRQQRAAAEDAKLTKEERADRDALRDVAAQAIARARERNAAAAATAAGSGGDAVSGARQRK